MVTALVAESPPQTPTPVSEAFVMVLVGFGVDLVLIGGHVAAAGMVVFVLGRRWLMVTRDPRSLVVL